MLKKTEMVIFKFKQKKFDDDLEIRLCDKRLCSTENVKYMRTKIDTNLSWRCQVNDLFIKLNRANALLFKIRNNVRSRLLRSIYIAVFDCYFESYRSLV